ncbi:MAG: YraN family protein [Pelagimonas sp.]|jgi:putative endonuclease|nr:YraN family protein [Pelagimonas sp.]
MTRQARGQLGYCSGLAAEQAVAQDYMRRGYAIACERWRGTAGEIDLIAQDGDGFIFIEVKKSRDFGRAAERLSARQQQRLWQTAEEFIGTQPKGALTEVRFDVSLVNQFGDIQVIENAIGH